MYKTSKDNNILLKILIYILPFYILVTRSYEGLFLLIYYNYLQLWIKMKWRLIIKEAQKDKFNLIDIFMFFSFLYISAFSTGNVASISGFTLSSVFRFCSKYYPKLITTLIMMKILLPSLFVTCAHYEICKRYNYSEWDSLLILIAMSEIMNVKFFFNIKDFGSWREIGMSIAFFIISNVVAFIQFFIFLGIKLIYLLDKKINKEKNLQSNLNKVIIKKKNLLIE